MDMGFGPFATLIPENDKIIATDGDVWIAEGLKNGQYHVMGDINFNDPPPEQLGLAILHLAKRKIPFIPFTPEY